MQQEGEAHTPIRLSSLEPWFRMKCPCACGYVVTKAKRPFTPWSVWRCKGGLRNLELPSTSQGSLIHGGCWDSSWLFIVRRPRQQHRPWSEPRLTDTFFLPSSLYRMQSTAQADEDTTPSLPLSSPALSSLIVMPTSSGPREGMLMEISV